MRGQKRVLSYLLSSVGEKACMCGTCAGGREDGWVGAVGAALAVKVLAGTRHGGGESGAGAAQKTRHVFPGFFCVCVHACPPL